MGSTLFHLPCRFLDSLKQSFLRIKPKNLLATPWQPWLVPSGVPLLLLLVLLWVEGESPGPHWRAGLGVAILDAGLGGGEAVFDSRLARGLAGSLASFPHLSGC